jgi:hypothetical protein
VAELMPYFHQISLRKRPALGFSELIYLRGHMTSDP